MHRPSFLLATIGAFALLAGSSSAKAAQLQLLLPLDRAEYQTNETIDVSAVRSDTQALAAGSLVMTVTGADASKMTFTFPVAAAPLVGTSARHTENLHLNGYLLLPGHVHCRCCLRTALRRQRSSPFISQRARAYVQDDPLGRSGWRCYAVPEGENGAGFNVILTQDASHQEPSIIGGSDVMGCCLMGGGHQMDLRADSDWSDPNVYVGAIQRGIDRAFSFRTLPNAIGAHLYDEPGLTWLPNAHYLDKTGKPIANDQDIPVQLAAYKRAFGKDAPPSWTINVKDPAQAAQWAEYKS